MTQKNDGILAAHAAELDVIRLRINNHKEDAIERCERLIRSARAAHDTATQLAATELYGLVKNYEGRNLLFEAMQLAESTHAFAAEARLVEQIARSYYTTGEYRLATQFWTRCIELSEQPGGEVKSWIYGKVGLGQVYDALGNHEQAVVHHRAALSRMGGQNDAYLAAKIRINLAVNLVQLGDRIEARVLLSEALVVCLEHRLLDYVAEARFRLGEISLSEGDLAQASSDLAEARQLAQAIPYHWVGVNAIALQAEVNAQLGNPQRALAIAGEGIALAEKSDYQHLLQRLHAAAARYADASGDVALAYAHLQQHVRYQGQLGRAAQPASQSDALRPSASRRMAELAANPLLDAAELDVARTLVLNEAVPILGASCASAWVLEEDGAVLRCKAACGPAEPEVLPVWTRAAFPAFFDWLQQAKPLIAHDALHHRHTWEVANAQLKLRGIASLMAWPIRIAGCNRGMLLIEHRGNQRNWTPDDAMLGGMLADLIARLRSQHERRSLSQAFGELTQALADASNALLAAGSPDVPAVAVRLAGGRELLEIRQYLIGLAASLDEPLAAAQAQARSLEVGLQSLGAAPDFTGIVAGCQADSQRVLARLDQIARALAEFRDLFPQSQS
ncbi:MAG TPA: GAF domain-containing protein [Chitinolyticbacter sp.]|nr:GAF domain-containing protein [Chitinolyticbacter sp.]